MDHPLMSAENDSTRFQPVYFECWEGHICLTCGALVYSPAAGVHLEWHRTLSNRPSYEVTED